ncbi:MAG: response regulator [Desulfuromonadaceae bacterium]|nr:response regulator [Desulfuromonadaceae bacterium]MDD2855028.1 response regulator [Desulfuromonadaceae bacterium]
MIAKRSENYEPAAKARLMLVDDEECIRETVTELLHLVGIDSISAVDGSSCLRLMHEGFKGVILMDVMMPGLDGWATIREMDKAGLLRGNIVSMMTAMDVPDESMEGLQEVVIDYIIKPFEPSAFITSVRSYLELFEQLSEEGSA